MPISSDRPAHIARWRRPIAYSATVADPPRTPRAVILRGSCGHIHGIGLVWRNQRYIAWKTCR